MSTAEIGAAATLYLQKYHKLASIWEQQNETPCRSKISTTVRVIVRFASCNEF